jgi:hypothetical protein
MNTAMNTAISRSAISCSAFGLALVAGTFGANAQAMFAPTATVVTQPLQQTIQTTETVTTVRPVARRSARHTAPRPVVTTTRTVVRERIVPSQAFVAPAAAAAYPAPDYGYYNAGYYNTGYYDVARAPAAGPAYSRPLYDTVSRPLYDTVVPPGAAPAPLAATIPAADEALVAPRINTYPYYRYVYQPDRILVIDPATGLAVQAIPR